MSINSQTESVAADMDRIFRPLAGRVAPASASREVAVIAPRRRSRAWLTYGAPALVVLATVGLGVGYGNRVASSIATGTGADRAAPARAASRAPATRTAAAEPEALSGAPPGGGAPAAAAAVEPVSAAGYAADPPPAMAPERPPAGRAAGDDIRGATRAGSGAAPPVAARGAIVRPRGGDTILPGCVPGSPEDRCIYQDVLNADGRLRRAFARARQDGVSNRDLTAITRRWRQARDGADEDPDGTIRRYDQLADALEDLRRETGE